MNCGRSFGYAQDFGSRLSSQPALKRQLKGRENASSFSRRLFCLITLLTFAACLANFPAQAETHVQVLTRAYDNQRTGANLSEKTLKPSTVNSGQFGKLFMLPVDDQIYAGLLYAADVRIAGACVRVTATSQQRLAVL